MISHAQCDHPSTPGARAKCRRARSRGEVLAPGFSPPLYSLGPPPRGATPQEVDFSKERNRGRTPRDRDKQCDICGIEKIELRGRHRWNDMLISVGEDCTYYLDPDQEVVALP
jgi:hypothetical protein